MKHSQREKGKMKLEFISEIVRRGGMVRASIRLLLEWFDHKGRGPRVEGAILRTLSECQLETRPDFTDGKQLSKNVEFRDISFSRRRK